MSSAAVDVKEDTPAVGAVGEVRVVRAGGDRAGHPTGVPPSGGRWTRSTVVHICRTAKQGALDALAASVPGRPGQAPEQPALAEARADRAVAGHGGRAGGGVASARGKPGWAECRPGPSQGGRRRQGRPTRPGRSCGGRRLVDLAGVPADRSHRKLAHRGARLDLVHVSESTLLRVLSDEGYVLRWSSASRTPPAGVPWPDWLEGKPNRVWGFDFTPRHCRTTGRRAVGGRRPPGHRHRRRAATTAAGHLRQRRPDAVALHPRVPRRRGHRPAVRPSRHARPGQD
jgi:hypothetical protein